MSRRRVTATTVRRCHDEHFWDYGWDPGLRTFFAQLLPEVGDPERPCDWVGTDQDQIRTPEDLDGLMEGRLGDELLEQLREDQMADSIEEDLTRPEDRSRSATGVTAADRGNGIL